MRALKQVVSDIQELRIQGANQIALQSLQLLRGVAKRYGFGPKFKSAAKSLEGTRRTAVVLHNCIMIIRSRQNLETVDYLIDNLSSVGKRESVYSDKIIGDNASLMTYCHSGEAMSFIKHSWKFHKKKISLIACKTEPLGQGIRTAKEIARVGIPVTLIDDNAIGYFIKDTDMVVVGADALRKEGTVNKIGTSLLAQAAYNAGKPFYVIANSLKIDRRKAFAIEERPSREITKTPSNGWKGITIRNPAFDITSWKYVTGVVNEDGIFTTKQFVRMI